MSMTRRVSGRHGTIELSDDRPRRGGQAAVHRGRDAQGRTVAVKIAHEGESERRGLRAERDALRAIHGRHAGGARWLVPLLDEGELPDGRPFLVLPWIDHSMASWLRDRRPDVRTRLSALAQTIEAVIQLHRSSASLSDVMLHRDLKPGNLLIEEQPTLRVMLADLGGAKERALFGATSNTGLHTPWFAPLEQALPLERPPDPSVDVHALAVVIYTALVGRTPQSVMSRIGLLTQEAEELIHLHQQGGGRSAAEKARYAELRRASLDRLMELGRATALPDDDVARLQEALADQLGEWSARPEALADELCALLVPALRHALDPDPRVRLSRPETLLGAINAALAQLPLAAEVAETWSVAATPAAPTPPPATDPRGTSRGWGAAAVGGLSVGLLLACAGAVAVPLFWWKGAPGEPSTPSAAPVAGVVASPIEAPPSAEARPAEPEVEAPVVTTARRPAVGTPPAESPPATATTVPPTASPAAEETPTAPAAPAAPDQPPRVILSMAPGRGSSPYVWLDGALVSRGAPWQAAMDVETWEIELAERAEGTRRAFTLVREPVDARTWRLRLRDASGAGPSTLVAASAAQPPRKVLVQWCVDDTVRFGCPDSSDP